MQLKQGTVTWIFGDYSPQEEKISTKAMRQWFPRLIWRTARRCPSWSGSFLLLLCHSPTGKTHGAATRPCVPVRPQGKCLTLKKSSSAAQVSAWPAWMGPLALTAPRQVHPRSELKIPIPAPLASPKSEDFRVEESDVPGPVPGYTGLRRNRGQSSHLSIEGPLEALCAPPLQPLDHLIPDSLTCLLFLGLLWPRVVCLNFSDSPMSQVKVGHPRCHRCHRWRPVSRPRDTDQPGFPLSFPRNHCPPHHTVLILKRHFWKVGHKLQQVVLGLNQSCLSKQYYFCLATLIGIMASQKLEPKHMGKLISHLPKNEAC